MDSYRYCVVDLEFISLLDPNPYYLSKIQRNLRTKEKCFFNFL
jgi:hypothetical protein